MEQLANIEEYLQKAQAAYEADDSQTVAELCRAVLDADPDNVQAWELVAKFGGWDSKMYVFDIDFAIDSAKHALGLVPEGNRHEVAAEIYTARKRQVAKILESEMMMPSYTAAKQLHGTMMEWKRLLEEIPYLSVGLIEGEVALCNNLCLRSKLGIMPADRLVYTAYMSLNKKESYGETFRKSLAKRLEDEQGKQVERLSSLVEQAKAGLAAFEGECSEAGRAQLEEMLAQLKSAFVELQDQSLEVVYKQRLEELERQLQGLKPMKIFKRRDLEAEIAVTRERLEQLSAEAEESVAPLRVQIAAIEQCLGGVSA